MTPKQIEEGIKVVVLGMLLIFLALYGG